MSHGKKNKRIKRGRGIQKTTLRIDTKKSGKHICALCSHVLHGLAHGKRKSGIGKLSKTQKRPSGLLSSILCSPCRTYIIEESLRLKTGQTTLDDVPLNERNFVETVLTQLNKE